MPHIAALAESCWRAGELMRDRASPHNLPRLISFALTVRTYFLLSSFINHRHALRVALLFSSQELIYRNFSRRGGRTGSTGSRAIGCATCSLSPRWHCIECCSSEPVCCAKALCGSCRLIRALRLRKPLQWKDMSGAGRERRSKGLAFFEQSLDRIAALHRVEAAGAVSALPFHTNPLISKATGHRRRPSQRPVRSQ